MRTTFIMLSILLLAASCKKEPKLSTPDFMLPSTAVTFVAGNESKFEFTGTAGIIAFYSGEPGKEYVPGSTTTEVNKSIAVKGYSDSRLEQFTYIYTTKGVYKAYFVAKNANIYGINEVVRAINVTVTD